MGGLLFDVVIVPGASFILTAGAVVFSGLIASDGLPWFLVKLRRTDTRTGEHEKATVALPDDQAEPVGVATDNRA